MIKTENVLTITFMFYLFDNVLLNDRTAVMRNHVIEILTNQPYISTLKGIIVYDGFKLRSRFLPICYNTIIIFMYMGMCLVSFSLYNSIPLEFQTIAS